MSKYIMAVRDEGQIGRSLNTKVSWFFYSILFDILNLI